MPPEADLVVEMFGEERAAVVVSQRHAAGGARTDVAEDIPNRHADGLDGCVSIAALGDVPAQCFGIPVFDDAEQPDLVKRLERGLGSATKGRNRQSSWEFLVGCERSDFSLPQPSKRQKIAVNGQE